MMNKEDLNNFLKNIWLDKNVFYKLKTEEQIKEAQTIIKKYLSD